MIFMKRQLLLPTTFLIFFSCQMHQENRVNQVDVPVSVMDLKPELIERHISVTGTVKPMKEATLKAQVAGRYKLLKNPSNNKLFALGDYVKEGQQIILLENKEYENSIKLSSLELNLEISNQTYDKQKSLFDKGGVTLSELKQAEISYINAKYSYEDALLKLGKLQVKAPFSGVIVDLPHHTADIDVDAGVELVKVMDYAKMIMDVNFSENTMSELKTGQQVRVMNYMIPEEPIEGVVSQISPAISPETRSFKGNILINNPSLALRPGSYVKGEIITSSADSALVVPRNIIQPRNNTNIIFVVDNGFASERQVTFGLENADKVQVISGLSFNDKIVYKGFETLRDKAKVKIVQ